MELIIKGLMTLLGVFLILTLVFNLNPKLPRVPFDINLSKVGIPIYLPFLTSIILTLLLSLLFNFIKF